MKEKFVICKFERDGRRVYFNAKTIPGGFWKANMFDAETFEVYSQCVAMVNSFILKDGTYAVQKVFTNEI